MPFLGKLGSKNQNCQFKFKFGLYTNLNTWNSMVVLTFSVLDWKHPFWENLVKNIKIVSLSQNLLPKITHKIFENNYGIHVK